MRGSTRSTSLSCWLIVRPARTRSWIRMLPHRSGARSSAACVVVSSIFGEGIPTFISPMWIDESAMNCESSQRTRCPVTLESLYSRLCRCMGHMKRQPQHSCPDLTSLPLLQPCTHRTSRMIPTCQQRSCGKVASSRSSATDPPSTTPLIALLMPSGGYSSGSITRVRRRST